MPMDIRPVPPHSADARRLLDDYLSDLESRLDGWTKAGYVDAPPEELMPPAGALLVAYEDGEAVACGAVHVIAPGVAEVKRMSEAMALYRSAGYVEIGDYNGNPNATAWLERRLMRIPEPGPPPGA
jgi:hypothetical protein